MDNSDLPLKIRKDVEEYVKSQKLPKSAEQELLSRILEIYRGSSYDPEEAIGVVAAQSLSEPTTQMSLDYNENVIVKRKGVIRIVPIGVFVDKIMDEFGKRELGGWEVCDVSDENLLVPSITKEEKIEWKRVREVSRHASPPSLLQIKTLSGRKITATDSHSFIVRKSNRIVPVSGKELENGKRLPVLSYMPENCVHSIETKSLVEGKFAKKPLPQIIKLNYLWGWIFGAYLSEGNATKFYVSFSNTNPVFLSRIRQFAGMHNFTYNEYDNYRGFSEGHDIRVNSAQLSRLMKKTCRTGSGSKELPFFAYSAGKEFVSGLLRGYFDGDGNISVERRVIRLSSASEKLIDGVALLLTRFGIFSRKSKKREFSLSVPYKYAESFRKNIGFTIKSKAERLDRLVQLFEKGKDKYHDHIEMIGSFGDILVTISKKLGLPTRYVNSFTKRQKIGREALSRHIENFERVAENKGINMEKELDILKRMQYSDVVWDEITSISRVSPSREKVYDFSVEGNETFTTFEGILTHNTMRTYHFAGTAGIQVTLGLPRLLEIFDARKEPKTPTMIIHLKDGYQSVEKARKVAESIKEVRIRDVVVSDVLDLADMEIRCELDMEKLKSLGLEPEKLARKIKLRNVKASVKEGELVVKPSKADIKNIYKLKYKLLESHIRGIKGISQVVVSKEEDRWVINTLGSSLRKVFEIEGVDPANTMSNNIFEVCDILGIEAARSMIIKQAMYTIEEQGLGVDIRYTALLADLMTVKGMIRPIGRYGVAGQKPSVLARAAFEETKKHFTRAAIRGEHDPLRGIAENIIVNQVVPTGTGFFELIGRIPEGKPKKAPAKKAAPKKPAAKKPAKAAAKKPAAKKAAKPVKGRRPASAKKSRPRVPSKKPAKAAKPAKKAKK